MSRSDWLHLVLGGIIIVSCAKNDSGAYAGAILWIIGVIGGMLCEKSS